MTVALAPLSIALAVAFATADGQPRRPSAGAGVASADSNPHRSAFVARGGVRLHYLDWGGAGPVVVLLPGYSLTAHAFDDVGRLLSTDYRGIAAPPRGGGTGR